MCMHPHRKNLSRRLRMAVAALTLGLSLLVSTAPAQANGATVTAASAGTKVVGAQTNAWGNVKGFGGAATVSTQVLINGRWSTSQTTSTSGYYALPLTYGINTPGTYTFRVRATAGGVTTYSAAFRLVRTPALSVTGTSAGTKPIRQTTNAWGTVKGASKATVTTQVLINGKWSSSQTTTTSGYYALPLTYGINTPGTYTFRVRATAGGATAYSSTFRLKRTAVSQPKAAAKAKPAKKGASKPAATATYKNCAAVRAAGKAPIYRGQPGYSTKLDRDLDGVACE